MGSGAAVFQAMQAQQAASKGGEGGARKAAGVAGLMLSAPAHAAVGGPGTAQ